MRTGLMGLPTITARFSRLNRPLTAGVVQLGVTVSRSSGIVDYYSAGTSAVEVPVQDSGALWSAIENLLKDEGRRQELGREAREEMVKRFSRPVFNRRLFEALLRIFT